MNVYKSAQNCIVKLRLDLDDPTTKTNLDRTNITNDDSLYAKYRTNKAFVLEIYDKDTKKQMNEINSDYSNKFKYRVDESIQENKYDDNLEKVNTTGIHFFLSEEVAYFWNKKMYNDTFKRWYDNGKLERLCTYRNGLIDGLFQEWHELNGRIQFESNYLNGKLHGEYKEFYDNGLTKIQCNYRNGKLHKTYKKWYNNDLNSIAMLYNYNNDRLDGVHKEWYDGVNNQIKIECTYRNKKLHGKYMEWYSDGQIRIECTYLNGCIDGMHKEWIATDGIFIQSNYLNGKADEKKKVYNYVQKNDEN